MDIVTFCIIMAGWFFGGGTYWFAARNGAGSWLAFMLGGMVATIFIALAPRMTVIFDG